MADPFKKFEQTTSSYQNLASNPDDKIKEKKRNNREEELADRISKKLGEIFEQYETGKERTEDLLNDFRPLIEEDVWDKELISEEKALEIIANINGCADIHDKEEFVKQAVLALKPIIDVKKNFPHKFEAWQRALIKKINKGKMFFVNELVHYEIIKEQMFIHIAPGESFFIKEKYRAILNGLVELQKIVRNNGSIKEIIGTSWITGEHPGLVKKFGFRVIEVDEETRKEHFADEIRKVATAVISRDDFLRVDYNKLKR